MRVKVMEWPNGNVREMDLEELPILYILDGRVRLWAERAYATLGAKAKEARRARAA
jgi:hypothetical protein